MLVMKRPIPPREKFIEKEILFETSVEMDDIRIGDYPPDALVGIRYEPYDHGNDHHSYVMIYLAHEKDNPDFAEQLKQYEKDMLEYNEFHSYFVDVK